MQSISDIKNVATKISNNAVLVQQTDEFKIPFPLIEDTTGKYDVKAQLYPEGSGSAGRYNAGYYQKETNKRISTVLLNPYWNGGELYLALTIGNAGLNAVSKNTESGIFVDKGQSGVFASSRGMVNGKKSYEEIDVLSIYTGANIDMFRRYEQDSTTHEAGILSKLSIKDGTVTPIIKLNKSEDKSKNADTVGDDYKLYKGVELDSVTITNLDITFNDGKGNTFTLDLKLLSNMIAWMQGKGFNLAATYKYNNGVLSESIPAGDTEVGDDDEVF